MSKPITVLMDKEVSRKEFLGIAGLGLGSILGFSSIIKLLTGKSFDTHIGANKQVTSAGYGGGSYGS